MVERHKGFRNGVLAPALRIAFHGLFEETAEGAEKVGEQVGKAQFGGQFGPFGDDQVDPVRKGFSERGDGLGGRGVPQLVEAFDFGFDLAMRHKSKLAAFSCHLSPAECIQQKASGGI